MICTGVIQCLSVAWPKMIKLCPSLLSYFSGFLATLKVCFFFRKWVDKSYTKEVKQEDFSQFFN